MFDFGGTLKGNRMVKVLPFPNSLYTCKQPSLSENTAVNSILFQTFVRVPFSAPLLSLSEQNKIRMKSWRAMIYSSVSI